MVLAAQLRQRCGVLLLQDVRAEACWLLSVGRGCCVSNAYRAWWNVWQGVRFRGGVTNGGGGDSSSSRRKKSGAGGRIPYRDHVCLNSDKGLRLSGHLLPSVEERHALSVMQRPFIRLFILDRVAKELVQPVPSFQSVNSSV